MYRWTLVALLITTCLPLSAATIHVPVDAPTIQAGIDLATTGDTVLLAPGLYTGPGNWDVTFGGKNTVLSSAQGENQTWINLASTDDNRHAGIRLSSGEDSTSVIDGLTFFAAAISSFTNPDSAVIYLSGTTPVIRNCTIRSTAFTGIHATNNASPQIENCSITGNGGHGVSAGNPPWPLASLRMKGCIVSGNAQIGVRFGFSGQTSSLENCTVVGNAQGGVLLLGDPPKSVNSNRDVITLVANNIVVFNQKFGISRSCCFLPNLQIRCNDSFGNDTANWLYVPAQAGDTLGNISANPLFCNLFDPGIYVLSPNSPCAPANNSCGVLLGAEPIDEQCPGCRCGDANGDGMFSVGDAVALIAYTFWHGTEPEPLCLGDANGDGFISISDAVYLIQYIFAGGAAPHCP